MSIVLAKINKIEDEIIDKILIMSMKNEQLLHVLADASYNRG
ncbi:hypothetical protein [Tissierella carlieri]|nr:hypothetical protein [Tissierella carlieri]MDU5083568.1 hypothetical protein [Bacillota bacterium]